MPPAVPMEKKTEHRTVLHFLCQSGSTPIECWQQMRTVFGPETMSKTRVRVWHKCFPNGRTDFKDDIHTSRPRSARIKKNIQKIQNSIQAEQRVTVCQLADQHHLSKTSVHNILKKDLNLSKVAPKMILKLLTDKQKQFWKRLCEENLEALRLNPDMMLTVVTGDKSWVSVLEVETKQSSCSWVKKGAVLQQPVKACQQRGDRKAMLTVFFDVKGMILAEFLPPGETVDADQYCATLARLKENIRRKHPNLWGKVRRGGLSFPHSPRQCVKSHMCNLSGFLW